MEESVPRINPNWHLPNPRLPPKPDCPADQKWKDLAAGVDEKFKGAEERLSNTTAEIQSCMQTVSDRMEMVHREIEADMETKSSELIEKKMKEVEERLCHMMARNLKSMDKKLRRVEKAISEEMEGERASEVVANGQTLLPEQAFRDGREGEICSDTRMRIKTVHQKVGALEKSVARAMYHLLPKVDALFENLDIKSKMKTNDQITLSVFAAAGYRLPPATPYWVSDLSIFSLDKDLLMASYSGEVKKVKELLYQGADKNVRCAQGYTPLHLAAKKGHVRVLSVLLEEDADVNGCETKGITPLHWAAIQGHASCGASLIQAGADIERRTDNDWTALHFACTKGCKYLVQLLLHAGADRTVKNSCGRTPLDLATCDAVKKLFSDTERGFSLFSSVGEK